MRFGVAAAALLLAACGRDEPTLVGRWEQGTERVEFLADGRVLLHRMHRVALGEYAMVDSARVVMSWSDPLLQANAGDYRVQLTDSTARLCETYRPHRCMTLVRARSDWVEGPGVWVDSVPPRLADPPRLGAPADGRVTRAAMALRQLHALQTVFRAEQGRYAATVAELARVGWAPVPLPGYRDLRVLGGDGVPCMVADPGAAELPPLYVNRDGLVGFGEACPGPSARGLSGRGG